MIDVGLIRNSVTTELVLKSEIKRGRGKNNVMQVYSLDCQLIKLRNDKELLKKQSNFLQKQMAECKKSKNEDEFQTKLTERNKLEREVESMEKEILEVETALLEALEKIGNILDEEVVDSQIEEEFKVVNQFETDRKVLANLHYNMIFKKLEGVDLERGAKLAGHRGYILKEEIALLKTALSNYAVAFAREKKYCLIQPPVFMKKEQIVKTVQLSDFSEQLYSVGDDFYLIATSEQPISMMFEGERFNPSDLPLRYIGESLCFRKEAGAHGRDNIGIFRVHQFDKIEQFVICAPDQSKDFFKEMVKTAEEFYQSLKISYRVISIVSGALNDAAAVKYDLEALFPHENRYRELVSVSNCTDYQSRNGEIRYGKGKIKGEKLYVHLLNGTLCAIQRTLCCLVENYQTNDGIVVPEVLRKYYGADFIPFKN